MIELPVCRWRGEETATGLYQCKSPKIVVKGQGVPAELCARCYCRDHDEAAAVRAQSAPAPLLCEYLDEQKVLDDQGCRCPSKWVYSCDVYGECNPLGRTPGVQVCRGCPAYTPRGKEREVLLIRQDLAPGDAVVLSAAIESLHRAHPGRYMTFVQTVAQPLWDNHPRVPPLDVLPNVTSKPRSIKAEYPAINQSDGRGIHFMQACCEHLQTVLGVPVPLLVNRPHLHLTDQEKGWINQVEELTGDATPYWVVNAGYKSDFTAKWWGTRNYQKVVDLLRGRIRFVQVGELHHTHPPLDGVLDLRGRTDVRQLMRLVWNAEGGLGPSTFLQHLCAAFERPYVLVAGGREPRAWQSYPLQTMFSSVGTLPCCRNKACWASRTVRLDDGKEEDRSLCQLPVHGPDVIPECLDKIRPESVAEAVLSYSGGGCEDPDTVRPRAGRRGTVDERVEAPGEVPS